ncbi:hypothetical protein JHK87_041231 [Glycine soja]|nr:hypothetical protein JHK87_041231 [Glycine soja]
MYDTTSSSLTLLVSIFQFCPKMSEDKESHNISVIKVGQERTHNSGSGDCEPENGGVNTGDIYSTLPVAKNKIKEHDDKHETNVAGPSGVKIGEGKEDDVGEHYGSDDENVAVAGPSGVNAAYDDETEVNFDEDENNGLTAAEVVLRAQIEAERQKSGENKNDPTPKRQTRLTHSV